MHSCVVGTPLGNLIGVGVWTMRWTLAGRSRLGRCRAECPWRVAAVRGPPPREKNILFCRLFELRSVNKQDGTSFPFAEETRAKARGHTGRLSRLIHRVAPWRPSPST